jgi:carbamoyltransferase
MRVLGISPLDKDATASLVEDGRVLFAAAEERFSRRKQHAGFPHAAVRAAFAYAGLGPEDIDVVAYPFLDWRTETEHMRRCLDARNEDAQRRRGIAALQTLLAGAIGRVPARTRPIPGLTRPDQRMDKGPLKNAFYRLAGTDPHLEPLVARWCARHWSRTGAAAHRRWQTELDAALSALGLAAKLRRQEHHLSHAANAYYTSGLGRALIVTLDGYGSGLAGSVSLGEGGRIRRLHRFSFPHSLGSYFETVTSSLGFDPESHAGKVVGLAAHGDAEVLADVLRTHVELDGDGGYRIAGALNPYFARHLAARFPMIDVAAAYQRGLEDVAAHVVRHWTRVTSCSAVVLSGGVAANVKMNQRIHEIDGVGEIFIYPNMGDGGCGTGLAMHLSWPGGVGHPLTDVYLGPAADSAEIRAALDRAQLAYAVPDNMAAAVAARLARGEVIARFAGRMEYGPRALGNRSILCEARDARVNEWLNRRLGRTEFMPFAPVTLWEQRERCYRQLAGAEHAAELMTITLSCTAWMIAHCPGAVHVDGTARPQLIRRAVNPAYYDIVAEYEKLSGIPCLINTSFNMHEEPIVCRAADAVDTFLRADLDGLVIGEYYVPNPRRGARP